VKNGWQQKQQNKQPQLGYVKWIAKTSTTTNNLNWDE
jgi:hypothetical protein